MIRFLVAITIFTLGMPLLANWADRQGWTPGVPSFLYETTWLVAFVTIVIFIYLYRSDKASYFVQLYLLSMAVKLIACFAYALIMITEDRQGSVFNVLYFLVVYCLFTAVEIGFLYRRISR